MSCSFALPGAPWCRHASPRDPRSERSSEKHHQGHRRSTSSVLVRANLWTSGPRRIARSASRAAECGVSAREEAATISERTEMEAGPQSLRSAGSPASARKGDEDLVTEPGGVAGCASEHWPLKEGDAVVSGETPASGASSGPDRNWVDLINASSKWVTVGICGLGVIALHSRESLWFVVGMLLNSYLSKLLKRLFQQERPETAKGKKEDKGMPSSHSMSLTFFGTYATLTSVSTFGLTMPGLAISSLTFGLCQLLAWLRVFGGLHSSDQVIVGAMFGLADAYLWKKAFDVLAVQLPEGFPSGAFDSFLLGGFVALVLYALWKEKESRSRTAR